jgi:hypothetical protein
MQGFVYRCEVFMLLKVEARTTPSFFNEQGYSVPVLESG